jgi:hypothetical protein
MPARTKSRIAELKEKVEAAAREKGPTFDVPFRGKRIPLRRVRIKTSFPLYRIQSGRTRLAQSAYLEEHPELPKDFFSDPEDPKVQSAQHRILLQLISEKGLDQDLDDRGQLEPLVLTKDGFVVDGNRRLAALRQEEVPYVEAVVLPDDAQASEIYETELELQMQRETKAPYNWIDQALHIEYGIKELGEAPKVVADRMRLPEEEINDELAKLNIVRSYLEWSQEPSQYHKVPRDNTKVKQVFEEVKRALTSRPVMRKSEAEKRVLRDACFVGIKEDAGYEQIRAIIRQMTQKLPKVVSRLREKKPEMFTAVPKIKKEKAKRSDPLRALAEEMPADMPRAVEEVAHVLGAVEKAPEIALVLFEVVDELEGEGKEAKRQQRPLEKIRAAANALEKVELDAATESLEAIASELARVFDQAERIRKDLEDIQNG